MNLILLHWQLVSRYAFGLRAGTLASGSSGRTSEAIGGIFGFGCSLRAAFGAKLGGKLLLNFFGTLKIFAQLLFSFSALVLALLANVPKQEIAHVLGLVLSALDQLEGELVDALEGGLVEHIGLRGAHVHLLGMFRRSQDLPGLIRSCGPLVLRRSGSTQEPRRSFQSIIVGPHLILVHLDVSVLTSLHWDAASHH